MPAIAATALQLVWAILLCSLVAPMAHAEDAPSAQGPRIATTERRILVLRAEEKRHGAAEARIERALGQALGEMGFLVNVSPLPFREAQLALGCPGTVRNCGGTVAGELESEQLGVSSVEERDVEHAELWLYLFSPGVEREGRAEIPLGSSSALAGAVRQLAREVYGDAAPEQRIAAHRARTVQKVTPVAVNADVARPALAPVSEPTQPQDEPHRNHVLRGVGWSTAAVGGALLVSGFATSIASDNASDAYARREILTREDADVALASYARAERQADAARVLLGAGGVLVASGAAMLLWERLWPRSQDRKLQFSAVPAVRGVALTVAGSLDGRLR